MLRSISSRDLEAGVQEWVKPHVWLDRGPPTAPCEPDRLSTLYEIAPSGKLENLHHPKFGQLLIPQASRSSRAAHWVLAENCTKRFLSQYVGLGTLTPAAPLQGRSEVRAHPTCRQ